jgi:hypothetical protein
MRNFFGVNLLANRGFRTGAWRLPHPFNFQQFAALGALPSPAAESGLKAGWMAPRGCGLRQPSAALGSRRAFESGRGLPQMFSGLQVGFS